MGENKLLAEMVLAGKLKVNLSPAGERWRRRIRAGGAGIPAFYTPRRAWERSSRKGKEGVRVFDGKPYLMELGLKADFALVKAWKGDRMGNLIYRGTARNFNPMMATAAKVTIAEVEEILEPGDILPEEVHTPGIYVQRMFAAPVEKRIEKRTVRKK